MRLPGGAILHVGPPALADAIVAEWRQAGGMGGEMGWADVPLTTLAGTAQERIAPDPAPVAAALAAYGQTDLLCYRAEDGRLRERQAREWQPWLDWSARALDAPLLVTEGIMHLAQPEASLAALARAVAALDVHALAALGVAVPSMGSLVLGLALAAGEIAPADAHLVATLDERAQAERWGADAEAQARLARLEAEILLAGRYLALSREVPG